MLAATGCVQRRRWRERVEEGDGGVLCRGDVVVPLSVDHKPDRPDEKERVEVAGGRVTDWNGSCVLGVLATSRSIGDYYLKQYVMAEPEVTESKRTKLDDFLVITSDGLWDALSNEVARQVVRRCLNGHIKRRFPKELRGSNATEVAAVLAELAVAQGSQDNISVIVIELKKPN
ncbi:hypothetical protein EUGRSUZ_D01895 [Eucalyptus grandis]|uniref:Uncharacterized protein n=2 Tax=Eucalyptus grandis TaxID=71139 RepID=A0ACC3L701_EUCGR|nr:hypothetical protein EUGRSUZ_D01895 [Eucalyptus grandis]